MSTTVPSAKPLRIALLAGEYLYPPQKLLGVSQFIHTMAHGLKREGHHVTVVGPGCQTCCYDDDGVTVRWFKFAKPRSIGWWLDRWRLCRWLDGEAQTEGIDIAEAPDYKGLASFTVKRIPVVVRLHASSTACGKRLNTRVPLHTVWSEHRNLKLHPDWIAVSNYSRELTEWAFGLSPRSCDMIRCPVVCPTSEPVEVDLPERFVLFAGSICRLKGAMDIGAAAKRFLADHQELHLVFAGPDCMENNESVVQWIKRTVGPDVSQRVIHLGHIERSQLMFVMAKAMIFLFPSLVDTFGFVTAEAMYHGVPVIVAKAGGAPEFVTHGETGIVVPPNDPQAISQAVDELVADPVKRMWLGRAGQQLIREQFTIDRCVQQTVSYYRRVIHFHKASH